MDNASTSKIATGSRGDAPHWVRQIADSMIVLAAALTVIGVDLRPYFNAKGIGADSQYEETTIQLKSENARLTASGLALSKTNEEISAELVELKARLERVESVAHHPGVGQTQLN